MLLAPRDAPSPIVEEMVEESMRYNNSLLFEQLFGKNATAEVRRRQSACTQTGWWSYEIYSDYPGSDSKCGNGNQFARHDSISLTALFPAHCTPSTTFDEFDFVSADGGFSGSSGSSNSQSSSGSSNSQSSSSFESLLKCTGNSCGRQNFLEAPKRKGCSHKRGSGMTRVSPTAMLAFTRNYVAKYGQYTVDCNNCQTFVARARHFVDTGREPSFHRCFGRGFWCSCCCGCCCGKGTSC